MSLSGGISFRSENFFRAAAAGESSSSIIGSTAKLGLAGGSAVDEVDADIFGAGDPWTGTGVRWDAGAEEAIELGSGVRFAVKPGIAALSALAAALCALAFSDTGCCGACILRVASVFAVGLHCSRSRTNSCPD